MFFEWIQDTNNFAPLIAVLLPSAIALEIFSRIRTKKKYVTKRRYYKYRIPNRYATIQNESHDEQMLNNSYQESGLKSHFDFLGIHEDSTPKEIKNARDKMILSWHPDKNDHTAANQMVQQINHSYKTIKQSGKY